MFTLMLYDPQPTHERPQLPSGPRPISDLSPPPLLHAPCFTTHYTPHTTHHTPHTTHPTPHSPSPKTRAPNPTLTPHAPHPTPHAPHANPAQPPTSPLPLTQTPCTHTLNAHTNQVPCPTTHPLSSAPNSPAQLTPQPLYIHAPTKSPAPQAKNTPCPTLTLHCPQSKPQRPQGPQWSTSPLNSKHPPTAPPHLDIPRANPPNLQSLQPRSRLNPRFAPQPIPLTQNTATQSSNPSTPHAPTPPRLNPRSRTPHHTHTESNTQRPPPHAPCLTPQRPQRPQRSTPQLFHILSPHPPLHVAPSITHHALGTTAQGPRPKSQTPHCPQPKPHALIPALTS